MTKLTIEQKELFISNYNNMTIKELATKMEISTFMVTKIAKELGLSKQQHKKWTDEEINYIKENFTQIYAKDIAKHLGRTYVSVLAKIDDLGMKREKTWKKDEEKYLEDNFCDMTHKEIGDVLGRTEQAVRAKCFDMDLYKKEKPWEEWEVQFLKDNYMEMSKAEISEVLGRTSSAVQLRASRLGFKKSPYTCNYHYFDEIDTEEKAYWLGFFAADGWISYNKDSNAGVVGIELQYGDIGHLKKFNKAIEGNYQIKDRWRPCRISTKDPNKKHHMCVIRIFSLKLYKSLVNLGYNNNKSLECIIPECIRENLLRHFVRGYFDGNGSVSYKKGKRYPYYKVRITTASKELVKTFLNIFDDLGMKNVDYTTITENDVIVHDITFNRNKDKLALLDWMYKDCSIYLDRKYNKYLKIKENMQQEHNEKPA